MTLRPDGPAQEREVSACPAADFEHAIARMQLQTINGFAANSWRQQEEPFKKGEDVGNTIVSPADEGKIEVCPLCPLHNLTSLATPLPGLIF